VPFGEIGLERERPTVASDSFVPQASILESAPEVKVRLGEIGLERERLPVAVNSFVQPAFVPENIPQV